jgi:hypothetical protein
MAEIVNLRQARKAKARAEKADRAQANRVTHGTPKHLRRLEDAKARKAAEKLAGHKLEPEK